MSRLAGDEELLAAMAGMVTEDAPVLVGQLQQSLQTSELDAAAALAHKLKGMFSTFETGAPVSALQDLIHSARAGKASEADQIFRVCRPQLEQLLQEISDLTK